jgi:hypothetical protein
MTRIHYPLETSNGWTGFLDAATAEENSRLQRNENVHPEEPIDDDDTENKAEFIHLNEDIEEEGQLSENEVGNKAHEEKDDDDEKVLCLNCCCCRHFPRISLLFIGILFPLWTLISISTLFGIGLSVLESPHEGTSLRSGCLPNCAR